MIKKYLKNLLLQLPMNWLYQQMLTHAMDDAAELLWIPVKELRPEDFGLASVRKGIEKLLAQWP